MTPIQYADDLYTKSYNVADVYDESTLNESYIKDVDPFIYHSAWEYWATHPQADGTNIAFKAHALLEIQKEAADPANDNNQVVSSKKKGKQTWKSHLFMQSKVDHQRHQHARPNTAWYLCWSLLFTLWLHLIYDWVTNKCFQRYHHSWHPLAKYVTIRLTRR